MCATGERGDVDGNGHVHVKRDVAEPSLKEVEVAFARGHNGDRAGRLWSAGARGRGEGVVIAKQVMAGVTSARETGGTGWFLYLRNWLRASALIAATPIAATTMGWLLLQLA